MEHPSGIVPTIQNVVASVDLGCKINREYLAANANNAEYNPKKFNGGAVVMRIREPKATALIFASGKMVCSGAKSEADSELAALKIARTVKKLGHPLAEFNNFKINNIVASVDVKFLIKLDSLAAAARGNSSYEPEIFPGMKYKMSDPKVTMLLFTSGKMVITGAKVREDTYRAFETIYPLLASQSRKTINCSH